MTINDQLRQQADDALETIGRLADQVGVKCADCGTILNGRGALSVASPSWLPSGVTITPLARSCHVCAEAVRGDAWR